MKKRTKLIIIGGIFLVAILAFTTTVLQKHGFINQPKEPIFVLDSDQELTVTSVSPGQDERDVSVDTQIVITLSQSLNEREQTNLTLRIDPHVEGVIDAIDQGRIIRFQPNIQLETSRTYTAILEYGGKMFSWSFSTSPSAKLSRADILLQYPWYDEFPIATDQYVIRFDINQEKFEGVIFTQDEANEEAVKNIREIILAKLSELGISHENLIIDIQTAPPLFEIDYSEAKKVFRNQKYSPSEIAKLNDFIRLLPYSSEDFDATYLASYTYDNGPLIDVQAIFITKKSIKADQAIQKWFEQNNLGTLTHDSNLFLISDPSLDEARENVLGVSAQSAVLGLIGQVHAQAESTPSTNPLIRLLQILFGFDTSAPIGKPGNQSSPGFRPGGGIPTAQANQLAAHPNLILTPNARQDLINGVVDPRLVNLLNVIVQQYSIAISVFQTGHAKYTVNGTISNHYYGRAADIGQVNGISVSPSNQASKEITDFALSVSDSNKPSEVGSPFYGGSGAIINGIVVFQDGHYDHLHIGYSAQ